MTEQKLSALAVEAITVASIKTSIPQKAVFRPAPDSKPSRDARALAMDHMKSQGANVAEISRVFAVSEKTVRNAIKNL